MCIRDRFTTSSETPEEVGMSSVWLSDTPNIYLNSFCFGFRPNQKIDPYFLGYSLRAPYMRDKIKILAQGISPVSYTHLDVYKRQAGNISDCI